MGTAVLRPRTYPLGLDDCACAYHLYISLVRSTGFALVFCLSKVVPFALPFLAFASRGESVSRPNHASQATAPTTRLKGKQQTPAPFAMKIAKPFAATSLASLPASLVVLLLATTASPALAADSSDSNGLTIDITRPISCIRQTHAGDTISVHYRGTLLSDGTLFDESYKRGSPFSFTLGAHQVIKGWDQGLLDMCIGEARRLTIPPELAYGERRTGPIPAGSTLVFETELMGIEGVVVGEEPVPFAMTSGSSGTSATAGGVTLGTATSQGGFHIATAPATPTVGAVSGQKDHDDSDDDDSDDDDSDDDDSNDDEDEPTQNPGECKLLGPFALLVQGALGALALLSLVWKRYRETPRRPVKVWAFDASKQVLGSFLTHVLNLLMSMFSSGDFATKVASAAAAAVAVSDDQGNTPNPCSFYLLNLAIDVRNPPFPRPLRSFPSVRRPY